MRLIDADKLKDDIFDNVVRKKRTAIMDIIDEQPAKGEWISVNDQLPTDYNKVLAAIRYPDGSCSWRVTHYAPEEKIWPLTQYKVTHWMPLPALPEVPDETD